MSDASSGGRITLAATPIGNLGDAAPRVIEVLASADVIACEDTRVAGKLFELLGIERAAGARFVSYHDQNERERVDELLREASAGKSVVVVSDAGMPAIADPGYRIVAAARERGVDVTVVPGPCAAVVALAGAGLPTDRFAFHGFLPSKRVGRREALEELRTGGMTAVLYESPHRVQALLEDVVEVLGDVEVCVARELTKLHEEWLRGTATQVRDELAARARLRGEFVVVIEPGTTELQEDDVDRWISALWAEDVAPAQIKAIVARATGMKKSEVWERLERLKD